MFTSQSLYLIKQSSHKTLSEPDESAEQDEEVPGTPPHMTQVS